MLDFRNIPYCSIAEGHFESESRFIHNVTLFILYLDEKPLPCIDEARKQNQVSDVTREGYTRKIRHGLASKNTVKPRGQEACSLEQAWSWHSRCLDNTNM